MPCKVARSAEFAASVRRGGLANPSEAAVSPSVLTEEAAQRIPGHRYVGDRGGVK